MKETAGIYVHIPFCLRKCEYCDFHSIVVNDRSEFLAVVDSYLCAVQREAQYYASWMEEYRFETLFLGGGTPTAVPAEKLAEVVVYLRELFQLPVGAEITCEANPKTITAESLNELRDVGVNRISLGAQAFQDSLLDVLGRTHSAADVSTSVQALHAAGFTDFNLDLMFGLPGQTMADWQATLERAVDLAPTHLSCYSLIVEEGTPFYDLFSRDLLDLPGEDTEADMYALARDVLQRAGYRHYEVSNFALPGNECAHNLLYWKNQPYLGLGSSASGRVGTMRYTNAADVPGYIAAWQHNQPNIAHVEALDKDKEMDETLICGLRLLDGVSEAEFRERFGCSLWEVYPDQIKNLEERGLVQYRAGRLSVTTQGLFLGNVVYREFLRSSERRI
ncbi:MAG: radical SAM family heme chaperone HemW [Firmicutes bacterium]|nr:radical SAM family heme chaperone HemW [Bacillota bacterium]